MNISYLTNFYPPQNFGGTEIYTKDIAESFSKKGNQVDVICASDWGLGEYYYNGYSVETNNGVRITRHKINWAKSGKTYRSLYSNDLLEEVVIGNFLKSKTDIVHITSCYTLSVNIINAARRASLPIILTLTDYWFICPRINLMKSNGQLCNGLVSDMDCFICKLNDSNFISRLSEGILKDFLIKRVLWNFRKTSIANMRGFKGHMLDITDRRNKLHQGLLYADYLISPSKFLANKINNVGLKKEIDVIPHGLDISWVENHQNKNHKKRLNIGYLGQLSYEKGVHVLIEAFKKLNNISNTNLLIFGPLKPNNSYIQRLLSSSTDDPNIFFKGSYGRRELSGILNNLDVIIVPSITYETYGIVIQEAFATKTPVIASRVGAYNERIINGVNGLLFSPGDSSELSEHLKKILSNPLILFELQSNIPLVKTIDQETIELESIYRQFLQK